MELSQIKENELKDEVLLSNDRNRFVLFPVRYNDIWNMYKKSVASFWTPEEINFSDTHEWERLTEDEKYFIKYTLAFFAGSDGIVIDNIAARFMHEVKVPEASAFYAFQSAIEAIHSETYSLLIDSYIKDMDDKVFLFDAINKIPSISKKANWALKWIDNTEMPFAARLIAFGIVEGLFFSSSFAAIYFIKQKGILNSLTFSNELISRDESLHTEFAVLLYSYIKNKLKQEDVYEMMKEAVDIEIDFVTESLPCRLLGMNSELMTEYIKFIADRLLVQFGYETLYGVINCPLDFMERISITNKSNFFEVRVAEYSKADVGTNGGNSNLFEDTEEDF